MNLLYAEIKKNMHARMIVCILVLFSLNAIIMIGDCIFGKDIDKAQEKVILNYQKELMGKLTTQDEQYIEKEKIFIGYTIGEKNIMEDKYIRGDISHDEYEDFLTDYNQCNSNLRGFEYIYSKWEAVQPKKKEAHWIVYDQYWEKLFQHNIGMLIEIFCLLLISYNIFSIEKNHSFWPILQSTYKGRRIVIGYKLAYGAIFGGGIGAGFALENFLLYDFLFALPQKGAPISSITESQSGLTILQSYIIISLLQILFAIIFCIFNIFMSCLLKREIQVIAGIIMVIVLCEGINMLDSSNKFYSVAEIMQGSWLFF